MNRAYSVGVVLVLLVTGNTFAAAYGGGTGTAGDPYQIRTPQQMNTIGTNTGDYGKHFILMADLDMSGYSGTQYNVIGDVVNKFTGVFDGAGHVIRNLTYSTTSAFYDIGLFGRTSNATIKNLGVENVSITSHGGWIGGLVGRAESGSITACYATGSVNSQYDAGGLAGRIDSASITNCYSHCSVASTANFTSVGGLVGDNESGTVTNCYTTGSVSATMSLVGGLVGTNDGSLTACFWDTQTSGKSEGVGTGSPDGVTGKTTLDMQTLTTFTDALWAFTASDSDPADWWMPENSYPRLAWEFPYGPGSGTAEDPYQIWTPEKMNAIGDNPGHWDQSFELMADLDMSMYTGTQYHIIGNGTTPFTGTFEGNGHVIRNLTYETTADVDTVGLFGKTQSAVIQNLGLENVSISTGGSWVGSLGGTVIGGTLMSCYATGSVSGDRIGGLVGYHYLGTISTCYAVVSVSGTTTSYAGGLVGYNDIASSIEECCSAGPVNGGNPIGGLLGYAHSVSNITDCFWDVETSNQPTSAGGTGKTTAEMKTLATFTEAGWDFVDSWGIGSSQTYPYLKTFNRMNPADINYSGLVDMEDLAILAANWLSGE